MAGNIVQGALFTVIVMRADQLRDTGFTDGLAAQIGRSPRFFLNAPVVLDMRGALDFNSTPEYDEAKELLRRHTLTLVGVQNAQPPQLTAAAAAGLASFAPNSREPSRRPPPEPAAPPPADAPPPQPAAATAARTRLVTTPVRSGTQIYARGADLVVTAPVGAGAEVVADGNIHVYGPLRGRALAGASGDTEARIFCSRLEAELISIAGHYLVSEQIPAQTRGLPVQIALVDDRLTIARN
jgi:septum site-determining protein MinC